MPASAGPRKTGDLASTLLLVDDAPAPEERGGAGWQRQRRDPARQRPLGSMVQTRREAPGDDPEEHAPGRGHPRRPDGQRAEPPADHERSDSRRPPDRLLRQSGESPGSTSPPAHEQPEPRLADLADERVARQREHDEADEDVGVQRGHGSTADDAS